MHPFPGRFVAGTPHRQDTPRHLFPTVVGHDLGACPFAQATAQVGVVVQRDQFVGQIGGVAGIGDEAGFAVDDHLFDLSDAAGDDGQSGGHVFIELERREVEVVQVRVGRGGYVHASQQIGDLRRVHGTGQFYRGGQSQCGHLFCNLGAAGAVAHDEQLRARTLRV